MDDFLDKMDTLMLKKILEEKSMKFTREDIEALVNFELEKDPSEMDTALIDRCIAALESGVQAQDTLAEPVSDKRKIKVKKVLLIAAAVALLCGVAISAGARFIPGEADGIIEFCRDHFRIDLRNGESEKSATSTKPPIENELILEGLHSLRLPQVLLDKQYEKTVRIEEGDFHTNIHVDFICEESKINGFITITEYDDESFAEISDGGNVSGVYKYFKQLSVDGTDILVFGNDDKSYIKYIDENRDYEIALNTNFDTAIKIAESTKSKRKG